jgi:hypothetical protein
MKNLAEEPSLGAALADHRERLRRQIAASG